MKFAEFEDEARAAVGSALEERGYPIVPLELLVPANAELGDLSCAVALKLAREAKKPPYAIAQELASSISAVGKGHLVGSVDAHASGYLNFRLNWETFVAEGLLEIESGEAEVPAPGSGKRLLIEHTNVNPNKALHVGHARNLVLGDSLVRIMKRLGYAVQTLNYIDDSGAQVADVIVGFKFLGFSDQPPQGIKFDAYCGDVVYTGVNKRYEQEPSLKARQRLVLQEVERGEGEVSQYARSVVSRILSDQLKTCWRLGASYDLLNWESHILQTGMWKNVFEELKRKGIAVLETAGENAGCWVLKGVEEGEEKVLVRSDGTVLYVAKDIPYASWKVGLTPDPFKYRVYTQQPGGDTLWTTTDVDGVSDHPPFGGADLAISVIDVRQTRLQKMVSGVLGKMAGDQGKRYLHRGYEVVALSKKSAESLGIETERAFIHMAGRKGVYINADTVLDKLKEKAAAETRKRNPDEPESWVREVAEKITIAAFRYELVKQDPDKIIAFDIEASLKLEGETGPYLLYSFARAKRILEKAGMKPGLTREIAGKLDGQKEKALVKLLMTFDKSVVEAGDYLSPKEVAKYAYGLSAAFNEFYEAVPVNSVGDPQLKAMRLALVDAFTVVLGEALKLIGIEPSERI